MVSMGGAFLPAGGPPFFCAPMGLLSLLTISSSPTCRKPLACAPHDGVDNLGGSGFAANEAATIPANASADDGADNKGLQTPKLGQDDGKGDLRSSHREEGQMDPGEDFLQPSHGEKEGQTHPGEGFLQPSHGATDGQYNLCDNEGIHRPSRGEEVSDLKAGYRHTFIKTDWEDVLLQFFCSQMAQNEVLLTNPKKCFGDILFLPSFVYVLKYAYDTLILYQIIMLHAKPRADSKVKKKSYRILCVLLIMPFHPGEQQTNSTNDEECLHSAGQPSDIDEEFSNKVQQLEAGISQATNCESEHEDVKANGFFHNISRGGVDVDAHRDVYAHGNSVGHYGKSLNTDADGVDKPCGATKAVDVDESAYAATNDDCQCNSFMQEHGMILCFYMDDLVVFFAPGEKETFSFSSPTRLRGKIGGQARMRLQMQIRVLMQMLKMKTKVFMMLIINAVLDTG